ncbi:MAG: SDR family oxidoreductase [Bacteroidia bacterium]
MKNKHFLITGASGAIGLAVTKNLLSQGAKLTLVVRSENSINEIEKELPAKALNFVKLDLINIDSISLKVKGAAKEFGPFDGFVHSAGIGDVRPLKMTNPEFIQKVMSINFYSFLEIIRVLNIKAVRSESLRIVGISATGAFLGNSTKTAYCASKAAMNAAVRCLAKELANKDVRINTVAPGATNSAMMDNVLNLPGGDESLKRITERQFLGVCKPEDIANGVLFLLSDQSKMISGQCLPIDGGKLIS